MLKIIPCNRQLLVTECEDPRLLSEPPGGLYTGQLVGTLEFAKVLAIDPAFRIDPYNPGVPTAPPFEPGDVVYFPEGAAQTLIDEGCVGRKLVNESSVFAMVKNPGVATVDTSEQAVIAKNKARKARQNGSPLLVPANNRLVN